jgi:hypothetical protein
VLIGSTATTNEEDNDGDISQCVCEVSSARAQDAFIRQHLKILALWMDAAMCSYNSYGGACKGGGQLRPVIYDEAMVVEDRREALSDHGQRLTAAAGVGRRNPRTETTVADHAFGRCGLEPCQ